jgi:hypothetical protein
MRRPELLTLQRGACIEASTLIPRGANACYKIRADMVDRSGGATPIINSDLCRPTH